MKPAHAWCMWSLLILILAGTFAACDNIYQKEESPFVKEPEVVVSADNPVPPDEKPPTAPRKKNLTRDDMEEIYFFVVTTRQEMLKLVSEMLKTKDTNPDSFIPQHSYFISMRNSWDSMVLARLNKHFSELEYPPDHPGYLLHQALNLFQEEMLNYARFFANQDTLNPQIGQRLEQTLKEVRAMIDKQFGPYRKKRGIPFEK